MSRLSLQIVSTPEVAHKVILQGICIGRIVQGGGNRWIYHPYGGAPLATTSFAEASDCLEWIRFGLMVTNPELANEQG